MQEYVLSKRGGSVYGMRHDGHRSSIRNLRLIFFPSTLTVKDDFSMLVSLTFLVLIYLGAARMYRCV